MSGRFAAILQGALPKMPWFDVSPSLVPSPKGTKIALAQHEITGGWVGRLRNILHDVLRTVLRTIRVPGFRCPDSPRGLSGSLTTPDYLFFGEDKPLRDGQTDGCHPGVFFLDGVSFPHPGITL